MKAARDGQLRSYVLRRLVLFAPTLGLVLLAVFAVLHAVPATPPTDPETGGEHFRAALRQFRAQYGLDLPVFLNLRPAAAERPAVEAALLDPDPRALEELDRFAAPALAAIAADPACEASVREAALAALARAADETVRPDDPPHVRAEKDARAKGLRALLEPGAPLEARAARAHEIVAAETDRYAPAGVGRLRVALLETRFATYLSRLARLDFGTSMRTQQPVLRTLWERLRVSLGLSLAAILLSYALAIPIGAWAARRAGTRREAAVGLALFAAYSLPTYFAATLLLRFLAVGEPLAWFPSGGYRSARGFDELPAWGRLLDVVHHLVLPVACLVYPSLAVLSRYVRAQMVETLRADFVRTARAKGLAERDVVFRHALKNSLLPIVTLLGGVLPAVFGGALVVEVVFDIHGIGHLIYESIRERDHAIVLASTLMLALATLAGFLLSDVLHAWIDPRVTFATAAAPAARGAPAGGAA